MTEEEIKQAEQAKKHVILNSKILIQKFITDLGLTSDALPLTLFMAGSPGVGKTEVSQQLISRFSQKPVRIDADEIRTFCPGYKGGIAHIFQSAATKGVNILYDYALHNNLNVILDGTFAYGAALENIKRALAHNRKVKIFYVYQDPLQAWDFTKKREKIQHRKVNKAVFIDAYFKSRENVNQAKEVFGKDIELDLLIKDYEKDLKQLELNIQRIDPYLKKLYNREELEEVLT